MATAGGSGVSGAAELERLSADQLRRYLLTWGVDADRVQQHSQRLAQIGVTLKGLAAVPLDVLLSLLIGKGEKATKGDEYNAYVIMAGAREAAAAAAGVVLHRCGCGVASLRVVASRYRYVQWRYALARRCTGGWGYCLLLILPLVCNLWCPMCCRCQCVFRSGRELHAYQLLRYQREQHAGEGSENAHNDLSVEGFHGPAAAGVAASA